MEVESGGHGPPIPNLHEQSVAKLLNLLSEEGRIVRQKFQERLEVSNYELETLLQELYINRQNLSIMDPVSRENTKLIHNVRRFKNKITTYDEASFPPFLTITEHNDRNKSLHPMNVAKLLHEENIPGIKEVTYKGKNKIGINFDIPANANKFALSNNLGAKGYRTFIPQRMLYSRGIIRHIGDQITEEDFISYGYGVRGSKKIKIVDATRFNFKKTENGTEKMVPGSTFMLLFAGSLVPQEVILFNTKKVVTPYVNPVIMCHKCLKFGHHQISCRNKERCLHCGDEHTKEECPRKDNTIKICFNCKGNHVATSKECGELGRQKKINKAIADYNISFQEATKLFPKDGSSEATQPNNPTNYNLNLTHFPNTLQAEASANLNQSNAKQVRKHTYASQVKKPKTHRESSPNYDQNIHREALFPSQARTHSPPIFNPQASETNKRTQDDSSEEMETYNEEEQAKATFDRIKRNEQDLIHEVIGTQLQGSNSNQTNKEDIKKFFRKIQNSKNN